MLSQLGLLRLILLANRPDQCLVLAPQRSLIVLVLLLQHPDHVCIIHAHPLDQVLIVPLRPRLALHAVVDLLLQRVVVPSEHL